MISARSSAEPDSENDNPWFTNTELGDGAIFLCSYSSCEATAHQYFVQSWEVQATTSDRSGAQLGSQGRVGCGTRN